MYEYEFTLYPRVLCPYHSVPQQWVQRLFVSVCHMRVQWFPGPTEF